MDKRFTLQDDCSMEDLMYLHPNLLILLGTLLKFADSRKLPVNITSIISDRKNVVSKSTTHEQGRALDVSIKGWKTKDIEDIEKLMLHNHKGIAAISAKDNKPRPVVFHNYMNQGNHIHIQVRR